MKPEKHSKQLLSATRSKAKMNEYNVNEEDHIKLTKDPSTLFTLAIGLLGDLSAHLNSKDPDERHLKELRENLKFSAHFFDAYLQTNLKADLDDYVLLLGSASYYLCDLPGSSLVLVNRIDIDNLNLECSNLDTLLARILTGNFYPCYVEEGGIYTKNILDISFYLTKFYEDGWYEQHVYNLISTLRVNAYAFGTPRELLFADVIGAVIKKRIENSSRKCLPIYSDISVENWEDILQNKNFMQEFWPAQHLLGKTGVFKGESAVIQLPTSAGKTKATEVIIRSAFLSNRTSLAVIVAPFRALCHEISISLSKSFQNESINIDEVSDVLQMDFELKSILRDDLILVVTPEKLIYMLRQCPELATEIGLLIYDEGHQFDSNTRGINYELLLTALKGMVPEGVQKVLISAVINNAEVVGSWLNGPENKVVSGVNLSPTYRTVALTSWLDRLGKLQFLNEENPDEIDFYVPRIIEQQKLQLKGRETTERFFPIKNDSSTVSLFLGLKLISNGSVAIFCGKKDNVSSLCDKVVEAYERGLALKTPFELSEKNEIRKLHWLYHGHLGSQASVTKSAKLGILTHHGNIPSGIRLAVEHSIKEGLSKFVICTSTLAQGVNLPIRYLIVTSIYQGSEKIKVRDFHNLIGRVGRSGMHTEGSVIFADPSIYDKRNSQNNKWRWRQVKNLLDPNNSEPVESSLLKIFDPLCSDDRKTTYNINYIRLFEIYLEDPDKIFNVLEKIAKAFADDGFSFDGLIQQVKSKINALSSIESYLMANWENSTNETEDIWISSLAKETLAHSLAEEQVKEQIIILFQLLAKNISKKIPQNSKKKLFGKMLYGVETAIKIEEWSKMHLEELEKCESYEELLNVLWPLLASNIKNNIFNKCEKPEILREVALAWIYGLPYFKLLDILKENDIRIKTKKQRRKYRIDHIVELCDNAFSYEGMLLIGAVAEIVESLIADRNLYLVDNLKKLQKRIKYGVPTPLSILFYELGFADRIISLDLSTILIDQPPPANKRMLKSLIQSYEKDFRNKLVNYPSYYTSVLDNILMGSDNRII
ncbi:DEAD/DEAH box helicase [Bacillus paranthracis]|uniref:DEAD/DEAH box helicase n=1 Tax=Bacillus paranthracis TaxID=2026186 RepID=UPI0008FDE1B9|nr:DEAD/DEAH box helicase [Bacillus paranthracis]OJE19429.1 DEAD/DEAH box helicase [Bacillus paranthracis]